MKYLNALASAALFVAGVASPSGLLGAHAQDAAPPRFAFPQSRRRLDYHVQPTEDIAAYVEQQHAAGVERPQFTIVAVVNATAAADGGTRLLTEGTTYEIDVIQAAQSVTSDTIVIAADGTSAPASDYLDSSKTLFVSANQRAGDFALVSVSRDGVDGISKKAGEDLVKLTKVPGGDTIVSPPEPFTPPAWQCGVAGSGGGGRRLGHDHAHDHDDHDHVHDHHHDHVHDHQGHTHEHHRDEDHQDNDFLSRLHSELSDVTIGNIERIDLGEGRRELYPTDDFPKLYSYQVNLYIETDASLRSKTSGGTGTLEEQMATVTNYVNKLVSAASRLYEEEVDTHLHVVTIVETAIYNTATSTSQAIGTMKAAYGASTWHTTGINLHHALLGNALGGGIASLGALCDPEQGFGLSASLTGAIASYSAPMYWDTVVFTHEIGHNFGASHTHENRVPLVDECGIGNCPSSPIEPGEATIMSYCDECPGFTSYNIFGWTLGGYWNEGFRTDIASWVQTPNIGAFNNNAQRVPYGMWEHASTRGTCMAPSGTVDEVVCSTAADCNDGITCTTDTCNTSTSQCVNTMRNSCCGNFVCESGEYADCGDCGPFDIAGPGSGTAVAEGIMFSIEAIDDLAVTSLTVAPYDATGTATFTVDVFTASGGWSDKEYNSGAWIQIVSGQPFSVPSWTNVKISFADVSVSAGSTQSFYLATNSIGGLIASDQTSNPLISDSHVKILNPVRLKGAAKFGTPYSTSGSWYGKVSYKVPEIGTLSPSKSPTTNPTDSPSTSPTSGPTENPTTAAPTTSPTASPSLSPTTGPTAGPTKSPVPAPTANPTVAPSKNPTASPSASPTTGPTESPTTAAPTTSPTASPSTSPTTGPTAGPTKSPVPAPTANPTVAPSKNPTTSPSTSPTTGPTESPTTAAPTTSPTASPSTSPTTGPTAGPTKSPVPPPTANPTVAPSKNPTASPSTSPTTGPTESPTTAAPTTSPTKSPSMSPTTGPTAGPTGSPVPPPTANPTVAPSKNPTASPSTSPTTGPTESPTTAAPTTKSPSTSPTPNPTPNPTKAPTGEPTLSQQTITDLLNPSSESSGQVVRVEVNGNVEITGFGCSADTGSSNLQASICNQLCTSAGLDILECGCTIKEIEVVGCTRRLQGRTLSTGQLAIDFVLEFITYCNAEDGGCGTEDITQVAQAVLQATDTNLAEAFASDTGGESLFITALKDTVAQSAEVAAAFSSAVVDEGSFSADIDIEQVVAAVLEIFREWYPAWSSNKHTCLNDGAAPLYMKRLGTYYEQSLADCCERFFSWDYVTCTGGTESSVTGFYPNWGSSEVKCLNATEELPPNYMRRNPEQWLHDDIDGCCEAYYHFDYDNCVEGTGGTLAASSTGKWYVDHQDEVCRKDCPTEDGGSCGGSAKPWLTLWETVAACCENELQWIAAPICEATSTSTAANGTQLYYVDWTLEKCVKDCEDSSDQECGGIAASYDPLYSKNDCCDRLWWLERSECTL